MKSAIFTVFTPAETGLEQSVLVSIPLYPTLHQFADSLVRLAEAIKHHSEDCPLKEKSPIEVKIITP